MKKKKLNMNRHLKIYYFALIGVIILSIIVVVTLSCIYLVTPNDALVLILFILTVAFAAGIIIISSVFYSRVKNLYYDNLYVKTKENIEKISQGKKNWSKYDVERIDEFKQLNDYLDKITQMFKNITFESRRISYDQYGFERIYQDQENYITYDSFIKNYRQLVLSSEAFRNAFIFFSYNTDPEDVTESDYKHLLKTIRTYLTLNDNLYVQVPERGGIMAFVPDIDSLSFVNEQIEDIVKAGVITKYKPTGIDIVECHAAMVVYPFSNVDDIIGDLRYAIRQGKRINIYLPDRLNKHDYSFSHNTLYLNNITKMYTDYNEIEMDFDDIGDAIKKAVKLIKGIRQNLGFESAGTIMRDNFSNNYYCTFNDCEPGKTPVFIKNTIIDSKFIEITDEISDKDHSYFFSSRRRASNRIGRYLDIYGIKSGHVFVIKNEGKVRGIVYFLNKTQNLYINNYVRESLLVFSTYLSAFSKEIADKQNLRDANKRVDDLLKLSDYEMYAIKKEDYSLTYLSETIQHTFKNATIGDKCYKTFYGLDEPCENCPLKKARKMSSVINGHDCETSVTLNRGKGLTSTLLITRKKDPNINTNRFHPELYIHSYYSLQDTLNNYFISKIRGSIVLINVDNYKELLDKYHDAGYFMRMKNYIEEIKNIIGLNLDIYAYDDHTLAVLFPEEGRVNLVKSCEQIYDIGIKNESIDDQYSIKTTFVVFDYPLDYPSPVELARYMTRYIKDNKKVFNSHNIVFADGNYTRSACRDDFLLSILDNAFRTNSLSTKNLPILAPNHKTITGAEILLRMNDDYLNVSVPAFEFIKVAEKNGRISEISNYLINYLGRIYQKYGVSTFKMTGFGYFSINTDFSYFSDSKFLENIGDMMLKYRLPKDFLAFEITESDIAEHYEEFRPILKRVKSYNIRIICDNFTGQHVSFEKLKEIGVGGVKVSIRLVSQITVDDRRFKELLTLIQDANTANMKVCLVGLEKKEQIELLKDCPYDYYSQGYYYYEPLDIEDLVTKLTTVNLK